PDAIKQAAEAIATFQKEARDTWKVPANRIHVVGSSGLPVAKNRDVFVKAVKDATGISMAFLDGDNEVSLSNAGIVPKAQRDNSILLDIGSGNTKGGYKPAGKRLASAAVPFGTVTYTNRVKKEAAERKVSFAEAAESLRDELLTRPLKVGAEKM